MATHINLLFITITMICLASVTFAGIKLVSSLNFVVFSIECLAIVDFVSGVLNIYFIF